VFLDGHEIKQHILLLANTLQKQQKKPNKIKQQISFLSENCNKCMSKTKITEHSFH